MKEMVRYIKTSLERISSHYVARDEGITKFHGDILIWVNSYLCLRNNILQRLKKALKKNSISLSIKHVWLSQVKLGSSRKLVLAGEKCPT